MVTGVSIHVVYLARRQDVFNVCCRCQLLQVPPVSLFWSPLCLQGSLRTLPKVVCALQQFGLLYTILILKGCFDMVF